MNRSLSDFYLGPLRMRLPRKIERPYGWKGRHALGNDRFQTLYGFLIRCSSDIARSVIVVIREEAADFPVVFHSRGPIILKSFLGAVLVHLHQSFPLILQASKLLDLFLIQGLSTLLDLFQFLS